MFPSPPSQSSGEVSSGWEGIQLLPTEGRFSRDDTTDIASLRQLVFETHARNPIAEDLKLPWEKGIFSDIFSGNVTPSLLKLPGLPSIQHAPVPAQAEPVVCRKRKLHKVACSVIEIFRDMSDEDYEQKLTVQWTKATVLWLSVFEGCDLQVSSGHHVRAFLQAGDRQGALEVIRDCFGNRSPSTACKRGQDLARFITWLHKKKRSWWPLKEVDVLDYLGESKKEGRSKSRGKELASAIRFFKHIMGAFIDLETVLTSLVVGRSNRLASGKGLRKQAPALTVEEVENLERRVLETSSPLECYYCGCLLFALFARCRWSDLACLDTLEFDYRVFETGIYGFIEGRTRVHKTGTSEEKKAMQMPLVAPIQGLLSKPWSLVWKESLEFFGLLPGEDKFGALCRPADKEQNLLRRSTISAEASDMLRFFIQDPDASHSSSVDAKTSHSLKATLLVWASRYGMDENSRTLLGHHALPGDSLACYSRDMLARPLRKLDKMIADVRTRRFVPDTTRSGWLLEHRRGHAEQNAETNVVERQTAWAEAAWYDRAAGNDEVASDYEPSPVQDYFPSPSHASVVCTEKIAALEPEEPCQVDALSLASPGPESVAEAANLTVEDPIQTVKDTFASPVLEVPQPESNDVESEGESESSSTSTSSDSGSGINEEEFSHSQSNNMLDPSKTVVAGAVLQNTKSKMIHRPGPNTSSATLCGIKSLANFAKLEGTRFAWPKCSRCFRGEVLQTKQDVIEFLDNRLSKASK